DPKTGWGNRSLVVRWPLGVQVSRRSRRRRASSDLHDFRFFGGQHFVDFLYELGRVLLHLGLARSHLVFGGLLFLVQFLEHVVGVAAMVADADAEFLAYFAHVLHQILAPLLGQLRDRNPDQFAVVHRHQAKIGGLDRFFNFVHRALVVWRDHYQARLGRRQPGQLPQRSLRAVVIYLQIFDQRG